VKSHLGWRQKLEKRVVNIIIIFPNGCLNKRVILVHEPVDNLFLGKVDCLLLCEAELIVLYGRLQQCAWHVVVLNL